MYNQSNAQGRYLSNQSQKNPYNRYVIITNSSQNTAIEVEQLITWNFINSYSLYVKAMPSI